MAVNLPALQASNTKYGNRRCEGTTDWGFVCFYVEDKRMCGWETKLISLNDSVPELVKP